MGTQQRSHGRLLGVLTLIMLALSPAVHAEQPGAPQRGQPPAPQAPADVPDVEQVYVLVRSTLLTLNDAVQTGNFTVLRDKAAPSFYTANNAARLAHIFRNLGQPDVELSRAAIATPMITRLQPIQHGRRLRVTGLFPGPRSHIDFDLIFERSRGRWRLFGISVNPAPVVPRKKLSPVRAQPAPSRLPHYSPGWDLVSNRRR